MLLFGGLSSRKEQNSEIALSDIWIFDQNLVTSTIASDPSQRVLHFPKLWKQCGSDFSHKSWRDCPEVCKYTRSFFSWCCRTRRKECGTHVTTTNTMVISSLSAVRFDRALKKTRKFFHGIISSSRVSFWVFNCIYMSIFDFFQIVTDANLQALNFRAWRLFEINWNLHINKKE